MKEIKEKINPKIVTKNVDGTINGFVIPIINVHDNFIEAQQWPKQVYLTVAKAGSVKGPHLHMKRWGLFTCIKGNIKIVIKLNEEYIEKFSGEDYGFSTVQVPAGVPCALVNISNDDAYILNMPSPSWHKDDQDDWDVEFNDYDFSKH
jgi:dTDP-4-dehydrorhamnose 3,5-epimerase-like enzyme